MKTLEKEENTLLQSGQYQKNNTDNSKAYKTSVWRHKKKKSVHPIVVLTHFFFFQYCLLVLNYKNPHGYIG